MKSSDNKKTVALLTILLCFIVVGLLNAQQVPNSNIFGMDDISLSDYLPKDVTYNPDIPTPSSIIGFEVGFRHVRHDQLVNYMYAVAAASDRVTITEYARTHGLRPLLLLTITSPSNHANLEEIRENHLKLSNPDVSATLNTSSMPVVVWHGYSVHGNEPSGANASLLTVYYLAAAQGPFIDKLLDESVVLVDPSINPDGLDRFAHWANMHVGKNKVADPNHREHLEVWPNGRTNHYWFDLNRDYMPVQHPESRGRIAKYHSWKPNIYNDFHEMGTNSTYFFQPGIPSRNFPLTPERTFELTHLIAEFHAKELNAVGSLYYTKESFDDFYVGKGSTYPDLNGSIGILYEQGSSRGHIQESQYGLVTFPFTIQNQFLTSISTMKAAIELRTELLNHQREFFKSAIREASASPVRGYVFGDEFDLARNMHLVDILLMHEIEVYELAGDLTIGEISFKKGSSYLVPANQKQYRFITSLFETRTEFTDSLFYDVSTWTLPLAFNIPYAELRGRIWSQSLFGDPVQEARMPLGEIIGGRSNYAYAFEWDGYYAPKVANALMKSGVKLMVASQGFQTPVNNHLKQFDHGTILIPLGIQNVNEASIYQMLNKLTRENSLNAFALNTGYSTGGIDLGSPNFNMLRLPSVMILSGSGPSPNDVGEIWHLFDQRWDMELSMVEIPRFNTISLDRYNTIIMVNGNYSDISSASVEKLRRWVSAGGTLILHRSAVSWARGAGLAGSVTFKSSDDDENSNGLSMATYTDLSADRGSRVIGGSIFKVNIDITHPLFYGYKRSWMPVFKNNTLMMNSPKNTYAMPMQFDKSNPLLSGYISSDNLEKIKGTAGTVVGGIGSGRIVMTTENPAFRAFWFGTNKLLANSIFFSHTISGLSIER
jgi:hypothetical protein